MTNLCFLKIQFLFLGAFVLSGFSDRVAAEQNDRGVSCVRQVTFELTYANQDMVWVGDPASPAASASPKPGAWPIATDFCVTTTVTDQKSRGRRYFREARIATENGIRRVYAFTRKREKVIGEIDEQGNFSPNDFYRTNRELLPSWPADASVLLFDEEQNLLYHDVEFLGPQVCEVLDFLPLQLSDKNGNPIEGHFSISFLPSDHNAAIDPAMVLLSLQSEGKTITLAEATVPRVFRGADLRIASFDNVSGTYLSEAAYRAGATEDSEGEPSVTVSIAGELSTAIRNDAKELILVDSSGSSAKSDFSTQKITIDGNFDDWRNVAGIDDSRGDLVPYLEYIPDVDILEFKVAHDDQHLFLYVRVAGQVGRSHPNGGRSYFYAYLDVDRNPGTGFLPTRDDDCYFGVDLGDDCEVQFEFVNNALRKTFYGFCGIGGNENVLQQQVTLGKSQYGQFDAEGVERANYKSEYTFRKGITEITEDLKLGTSDTIRLAVSPDGSEVEVVSTFTGFLKNSAGRPTMQLGQTIDLAVGMECDSKAYLGKTRWAADNTITIYGYQLVDLNHGADARQEE